MTNSLLLNMAIYRWFPYDGDFPELCEIATGEYLEVDVVKLTREHEPTWWWAPMNEMVEEENHLQGGAPKIAKLVYKSNNYFSWSL